MPLRSLLITLITVALALMAVVLWLGAVGPLVAQVGAATRPAPGAGMTSPAFSLHLLFHSTLLLSFVLICLLLVVGLIATGREWLRRPHVMRPRYRTGYMDIWKLAGERLKSSDPKDPSDPSEPTDRPKPPPFQ